jgi:hypothetical protein
MQGPKCPKVLPANFFAPHHHFNPATRSKPHNASLWRKTELRRIWARQPTMEFRMSLLLFRSNPRDGSLAERRRTQRQAGRQIPTPTSRTRVLYKV